MPDVNMPPLTDDESAVFYTLYTEMIGGSDHIVLIRSVLDDEPVAVIAHVEPSPGEDGWFNIIPVAVLITSEIMSRLVDPQTVKDGNEPAPRPDLRVLRYEQSGRQEET